MTRLAPFAALAALAIFSSACGAATAPPASGGATSAPNSPGTTGETSATTGAEPGPANNPGTPDDEVRRALTESFPALDRCYADAVQASPTLKGTVAVRVMVDDDGMVATATANRHREHEPSEILDPVMLRCIEQALRGSRFPPGRNGRSATHVFEFPKK